MLTHRRKTLGDLKGELQAYEPKIENKNFLTEDLKEAFLEQMKNLRKPKAGCFLCDEELPGIEKGVCADCKRVFAAFKSILVEEKACESK